MIPPVGVASAGIGVFTVDADLVVRTWDAWLERATGIAAARACGAPLAELAADAAARGLIERFALVVRSGAPEVLAPVFHHYLFPCPPAAPSPRFDRMQQRVMIGALRDGARIVGAIATVEDVTARLDQERALAEALRSPDAAAREEAARRVAAADTIESPETFTALLGHDDWRIRRTVTHGLAPHAHRDLLAALLKGLREGHRDFNVLSSALNLLSSAEIDLSGPLVELLADPDPDLRMQAALAIGEHQRPGGIAALVAALDDPDINVRFHVIEALGRLHAAEAIDALADIAESGDFFLAFPAVDALARLNDARVTSRLVRLLEQPALEGPVIDALGNLGGDESIAPLTARLNAGGPAGAIALALARIHDRFDARYGGGVLVIGQVQQAIRPAGIQHLIDAVGAGSVEDVRPLIVCLGWLRGPAVERALTLLLGRRELRASAIEAVVRQGAGVVDSLVQQLDGDDDDARVAAIVALGRIGDRRATRALAARLDDDRAVVLAAASALAQLGDPAAFEPLLRLLAHEDAAIRKAAIGALNSIGHPDMAMRVRALLDGPDPLLRESAIRIAGYFGYPECGEAIIAACGDAEERIRRAALEHLPFLDDPRAGGILTAALERDTPAARAAAVTALGQIDDPATLGAMAGALDDEDAWVRYYAARALGRRRPGGALPALARRAAQDPAGHVRIAALEAIGSLDGPTAADVLMPYAAGDDDELAAAALRALAHVPDPRVGPVLQSALRSPSPVRRLAAVQGLAGHPGADTFAALEWTADGDADAGVAAVAVEALATAARSGDGEGPAIGALIRLAASRERGERAVAALAGLPATRIATIAARFAGAGAPERVAVVDALGRMRHPDASAVIMAALHDPDERVRCAAIGTLDRLGARGTAKPFAEMARHDPSRAVRRAAAAALGRTVDPAADGTASSPP